MSSGPTSGEPSSNGTVDECVWTWNGSGWGLTSQGTCCNDTNRMQPSGSGNMPGSTEKTYCSGGVSPCDEEDED